MVLKAHFTQGTNDSHCLMGSFGNIGDHYKPPTKTRNGPSKKHYYDIEEKKLS